MGRRFCLPFSALEGIDRANNSLRRIGLYHTRVVAEQKLQERRRMETKQTTPAQCAVVTIQPGETTPAKTYTNYDGPVPPETCEHFCSRCIDCAKSGLFYPVPVGDACGELWQALVRSAAKMPRLESASTATYLHRTVENLIRRYFTRVVAPLR